MLNSYVCWVISCTALIRHTFEDITPLLRSLKIIARSSMQCGPCLAAVYNGLQWQLSTIEALREAETATNKDLYPQGDVKLG